ncbi:MAG TPA: DoxX family protein [Streptosporangiaceae bacterium]|nr:DoxX family protein [Streptosporangiaceae bacterium]
MVAATPGAVDIAVTVVTAAATGGIGAATATRAQFVLKFMREVGVPDSWPPALGAVKVAGAVGLLAGLRAKPLGIAAGSGHGSGLVLYFCGAVITHVRAGAFRNISFPAAYLGLSSMSLALATRRATRPPTA